MVSSITVMGMTALMADGAKMIAIYEDVRKEREELSNFLKVVHYMEALHNTVMSYMQGHHKTHSMQPILLTEILYHIVGPCHGSVWDDSKVSHQGTNRTKVAQYWHIGHTHSLIG